MDANMSQDNTKSEGMELPESTEKKKKYTARQLVILVALCVGQVGIGALCSLQGPFFPKEAESKNSTATEYGLIQGTYQLALVVTTPILAKLLVELGSVKLFLLFGTVTLGSSAIAFGFLAYAQERYTFIVSAFVIRILEGIGAGCFFIPTTTIAATQFPDRVTTVQSFLQTSLSIGLMLGPSIGGILYDAGGFLLPFSVVGAFLLLLAVVFVLVLPICAKKPNHKSSGTWKFWCNFGVLVDFLSIFSFCYYIGFNIVTLEPHLRPFQLSGLYVGLVFAAPSVMGVLCVPLYGWICDKKGNVDVFLRVGGYILMIASQLLLGPMPFLSLPKSIWLIVLALVISSFGGNMKLVSSFSTCIKGTLDRGYQKDFATYGLVSSVFAAAQSLGLFLGPTLCGYLIQSQSYNFTITTLIGMEAILLLLTVIHLAKKKCS